MSESLPTIIYIADPMCSWCWGFTPVLERIEETYRDRIVIDPVVGGLRPGTKEPLNDELRETILHHWHEVNKASGQPFGFDFNVGDDFVYDTEPPCRAVVAVRGIRPEATLDYFHALHKAFYVDNLNITKTEVLADLAETFDIQREEFIARFELPETQEETFNDFARARSMGINGFPAAVVRKDEKLQLLTYGYVSFEDIQPRIDAWLGATV